MKLKKDKKNKEKIDNADFDMAVLDMTQFLLNYNFTPEEAYKISRDFFKKHKDKLQSIL